MGLVKQKDVSQVLSPPTAVAPVEAPQEKAVPTRYGKQLSDYEIEMGRRIHVSGIVQAVASSPSILPFIMKQEDYSRVVKEESIKLLAIAQELVVKH